MATYQVQNPWVELLAEPGVNLVNVAQPATYNDDTGIQNTFTFFATTGIVPANAYHAKGTYEDEDGQQQNFDWNPVQSVVQGGGTGAQPAQFADSEQ
jgi:hypothetical protein